jgi:two-component system, sensor histidine kinase and response regulator
MLLFNNKKNTVLNGQQKDKQTVDSPASFSPLYKLVEAINRAAAGDYSHSLEVVTDGNSELSALAASVNRLINNLRLAEESRRKLEGIKLSSEGEKKPEAEKSLQEMASRIAETEALNKRLDEREQALLNVLEDQKRLEEQLRRESFTIKLLHEITTDANDAESIEEAFQKTVDKICSFAGWPVGHVYNILQNPEGGIKITPSRIWNHAFSQAYANFKQVTELTEFKIGEGLPGKVFREGLPVWISNVQQDPDFVRAKKAYGIPLGINTAFAFPVMVGKNVMAVLEFFTDQQVGRNEQLLEIASQIGTQLGRVIERSTAAKALQNEKESVEKKVEERTYELRQERARLEASINSLHAGFIMTDKNQEILMINGVAKYILCLSSTGHADGSAIGAFALDDHCTMTDIDQNLKESFDLRSSISQCISGQKIIDVKNIEYKDRFLRVFIAPIATLGEKVEVIGSVILIEDTTQERMLEKSRDEFFSIASHELRTPLTAIQGNAALIKQYFGVKLIDKDLVEMIDDIYASSDRLIEIVNDYLDLSRLEMGRMEFKIVGFDLPDLIAEVLKETEVLASEKKLELRYIKPPVKPALAFGDRNRSKQVLLNLVGNAIKYTDRGSVSVSIDQAGGMLKVSVTDTGPGIPPKNQGLLFHKFQRSGSTVTKDAIKGTGLGLYISRLLMTKMNGQVFIERSAEGQGSTFAMTIPANPTDEEHVASAKPVESPALPAGSSDGVAEVQTAIIETDINENSGVLSSALDNHLST